MVVRCRPTTLTFADEGTIFLQLSSLFDEAGDDDYATACESARRLIRSLRSERPTRRLWRSLHLLTAHAPFTRRSTRAGRLRGTADRRGTSNAAGVIAAFTVPKTASSLGVRPKRRGKV